MGQDVALVSASFICEVTLISIVVEIRLLLKLSRSIVIGGNLLLLGILFKEVILLLLWLKPCLLRVRGLLDLGNLNGLLLRLLRWIVRLVGFNDYTRDCGTILSLCQLAFIKSDILALKFAHFLNLIEIHNKALLVSVINLNALTTKDCAMI